MHGAVLHDAWQGAVVVGLANPAHDPASASAPASSGGGGGGAGGGLVVDVVVGALTTVGGEGSPFVCSHATAASTKLKTSARPTWNVYINSGVSAISAESAPQRKSCGSRGGLLEFGLAFGHRGTSDALPGFMVRFAAVLILAAACGACAGRRPPPNPPVSVTDEAGPKGRGHDLVVLAASCWLNGLWADALGEKPSARERTTHERCKRLLDTIDRPSDDEEALRALDPRLVDATVRQAWRTALADRQDAGRARELVMLLDGTAAAAREMLRAHRVVDSVYAMGPEQRQDRSTMTGVAQALRDAAADRALLRMGGPFAGEAHALGLMFALDRMDLARDLPTSLKLDALSGVFLEVFRVSAPKPNSSEPQWLDYLAEVATAAGHPPAASSSHEAREALAWDGILTGFAEQLRAAGATGLVGDVARGAADRIDAAHVR